MAFNHVALAIRDLEATHRFYTEDMGFTLVKAVPGPTEGGGWAKHLFYDSGGGELMAFWDLHDDSLPPEFPTAISTGIGLPSWVNHIAFDAATLDDLAEKRTRWQEHGHTVAEIDHGFCVSIYTTDPNGILVEFCCMTRPLTAKDAAEAEAILADPLPALDPQPAIKVHKPVKPVVVAR